MKTLFNKKNVTNFICFMGLISFLLLSTSIVHYYETHYTMNATVVGVNKDIVLVEDNTGNLWEFYGTGFQIDNKVSVKFYTSETDHTREDDQVKNVSIITSISSSTLS